MARAFIDINEGNSHDIREQVAHIELDVTDSRNEDEIVDDLIFHLHCYQAQRAAQNAYLRKLRDKARDAYSRLSWGILIDIPELGLAFPPYTFQSSWLEYAGAEILPKLTTAFNRIADEAEAKAEAEAASRYEVSDDAAVALDEMDLAEGLRPIG